MDFGINYCLDVRPPQSPEQSPEGFCVPHTCPLARWRWFRCWALRRARSRCRPRATCPTVGAAGISTEDPASRNGNVRRCWAGECPRHHRLRPAKALELSSSKRPAETLEDTCNIAIGGGRPRLENARRYGTQEVPRSRALLFSPTCAAGTPGTSPAPSGIRRCKVGRSTPLALEVFEQ